jgi:serine protease AprX
MTASVLLTSMMPTASAQSAIVPSDPPNLVTLVESDKEGKTGKATTFELSRESFRFERGDSEIKKDPEIRPNESRLHPRLEQLLASGDPHQPVTLVINLKDDLVMPRLPDPKPGETRESTAGKEAIGQTEAIIEQLRQQRQKQQASTIERLRGLKAEVDEQFWLINGIVVTAPLESVKSMLQLSEVLYIEPRDAGEKPPDANPDNDVLDGRDDIDSDPYFNLPSMTGGYIGLLDTGVRATHTLFAAPGDHIDFLRDCVQGGPNCNDTTLPGYNTDDDCWNHGTSTAAIVTGNSNLGTAYRGGTGITLDSWKVYPNACGFLDSTAVVRGFQRGLAVLDRVFIAEMQSGGSPTGSIATAADNAFATGAVVIAANGNNGPSANTVNSPANAHKVIGIGAFDVDTLAQYGNQSRGPAPDGRIKPDIQAPTNSETASTASATALQVFTGTSGATPYGAIAGALTRNYLINHGTTDPGATYARLILSGQRSWPSYDNTEGVGDVILPTCSTSYWGNVSVASTGSTINIPISVGASKTGFEAALWWPEGASEAHDDIDVYIYDPSGTERARGYAGASVFERAEYAAPLATGSWTVKIKGYSVASGPQTVYWAARVVGC